MTPEAQRIAIAELCGIQCQDVSPFGLGILNGHLVEVPDYLNDLNAMRKAVMTLKDTKRGFYNAQLSLLAVKRNLNSTVKEPDWIFDLINASAAHSAEALLKTSGKWIDDSKPEPPPAIPERKPDPICPKCGGRQGFPNSMTHHGAIHACWCPKEDWCPKEERKAFTPKPGTCGD